MSGLSKKKLDRAIRELSPLSDVAQALLRIRKDCDHTSGDVVAIIERDASLTIRVLRIANSPVIAPLSPVESLQHAVTLMGEDVVVTAALVVGANWMREPLTGYGPDATILENGLMTAIAAGLIAKRLALDDLVSLAYTGGLLHDIGKIVISDFLEPASAAVITEVSSGRAADWLAAEKSEVGFDHCEVGAMVADHFSLGPALRAVVAHHHCPSGGPREYRRLIEIIHVADAVRAMMGGNHSVDALSYPVDHEVLETLDIGARDFPEIIFDALTEYRGLADFVAGE